MLPKSGALLLVGAALALVVSGCKKGGDSSLKWGFREDFLPPQSLIRQPSGTEIRICGAHAAEISWAIGVWAAAANRQLTTVESCTSPHVRSYAATDAFTGTECQRWGFTNRMYAEPYVQPMRIVDCSYTGTLRPMVLHEVGHLWGLCDQYDAEISKCTSTTAPVVGSVMHSAQTEHLLPDDILGAQALAVRFPDQAQAVAPPQGRPPASTPVAAPIVLQAGTYRNQSNNHPWTVTPQVAGGAMTSVQVVDGASTSSFTCQAATCTYGALSLSIDGADRFRFHYSNGQVYQFLRQAN